MDYTIADLGGGTYRYDFTLALDNLDGTWAPGQQWDWIVFGDNDLYDSYNGFDTNGGVDGGLDWSFLSFSSPITAGSSSVGGHNGPTLYLGSNGVLLPGWEPSALGELLSWSGTSGVLIPDGELYWSALIVSRSVARVDFELAYDPVSVPEPATLVLLGIALAGLGFSRRRKLH